MMIKIYYHNNIFKIILLCFFYLISTAAFSQNDVNEKLALQYFQNKEFNKAAELYKKLYSQKADPFYYNYYLDCLFELEDYKLAKKFVSNVAKKNPANIKYKVEIAYIEELSGNKSKATKSYDKLIKSTSKKRYEFVNLANAFLYRGLNNYAIKKVISIIKKNKHIF